MKPFLLLLVWSAAAAVASPISNRHRTSTERRRRNNFGPDIPRIYEHGLLHNSQDPFIQSYLTTGTKSLWKQDGTMENLVSLGVQYAMERLGIERDGIVVSSSHTAHHTGVTHVYLQQVVDGLEVVNAVANVNVDGHGRIISFGSSFYSKNGARGKLGLLVLNTQSQPSSSRAPSVSSLVVNHQINAASKAVEAFARYLEVDLNHVTESPIIATSSTEPPRHIVKAPELAVSDIPAQVKYIQTEAGELQLVWDLQVEMIDNWYHAHVDTETGSVVSLIDWVADASYHVFPLGTNSPNDGDRVRVHDPAIPKASPLGWHDRDQLKLSTKTIGNNAYAQENLEGRANWENNYRPDGGRDLDFSFKLDLRKEPSSYLDGSITNLFYWVNSIHDLFYVYGFDEQSGNFQEENFGKGGRGNDAVIANAQDGSGYNNANFATPPDGQHGKMRMYVWDATSPNRDGDLESGIIVHEACHGLTNRLTGGPANSGCLGYGESGGMGEGWGDFIATVLRMNPNTTRDQDFEMGSYANGGNGIRKFKYSTSKSTNPSTYGYTRKAGYWGVHRKGEVWAEILFEVFWNLLDDHGFGPNWFDTPLNDDDGQTYLDFRTGQHVSKTGQDQDGAAGYKTKPSPDKHKKKKPHHPNPRKPSNRYPGNVLALQLIVDGLKLQPCNPTFVDARDAILLADHQFTGGANQCALWRGFASRGLGKSARPGGHEAFDMPHQCEEVM
ncbi:hypothetical protein SeMB42_g05963 [Synchytrium endobioticum]|uniref:Extracellular metalloproteinase n=1 Tax=Synchytrium endobioticum TaxID=286115 RepID=A0A507CZ21_9FUNG|nr:hypothetical protein SeMB42_g05963 [Synchytrium endobioticum]TPX44459.1 hypothetical protein SeLEV6574_g04483 [Synchytrium endobioticum]